MKIGLIRHFQVHIDTPTFMSSKEFSQWVYDYDRADILKKDVDLLGIQWDICYTSNLPRAIQTAEMIFPHLVLEREELREVPIFPITNCKLVLPHFLWMIAGRIAWYLSHPSQLETKNATKVRAKQFVQQILKEKNQNIIVVSHGFFLSVLTKVLQKNGFEGKRKTFKNGELLLFEK
ncbi:broad specificity phosphatase PhoE [Oikeobacillus pervagus]|uniref:Broad specificity phosphatase PhoE n=1 Tax=Oikeobacillus pervagus TaxID=1325931 RepID=A0AAJ1T0I1_9BACI|nr:histidine phosphatase family protein [Oikeobacillus pervagus]MDQ0216349.1 broad specificity phosphatase PhoE [Oikeobacillus pervagus]